MSKTNLITLFLTVIIVVIGAELLVNNYTSKDENLKKMISNSESESFVIDEEFNDTPNLLDFNNQDLSPKSTKDLNTSVIYTKNNFASNNNNLNLMNNENLALDSSNFNNGNLLQEDKNSENTKSVITFSLIGRVGFNNVVLQRVPFNGIMFERIDMRDFLSVPIIQQNLLQNNRVLISEFYEIHSESILLANEIYLLIKEKSISSIDAGVNETNEFGNGSFYINYSTKPDTAFLIVKINESVYAFVYKKELHPFINALISIL